MTLVDRCIECGRPIRKRTALRCVDCDRVRRSQRATELRQIARREKAFPATKMEGKISAETKRQVTELVAALLEGDDLQIGWEKGVVAIPNADGASVGVGDSGYRTLTIRGYPRK